MRYSFYFSAVLLLTIICVGWWWGCQYEEKTAVDILASHDIAELGVPVFAQFTITQKIFLKDLISVTRLVVPMYFSENSEFMQVDLRRRGKLVQRWRYGSGVSDEIINVELEMQPTQLLEGEIEIVFSAAHIDHENQDRAPKIFIEKSDANYPDGNYRIADNEKKGDVGLALMERNRKWELWLEELIKYPLLNTALIIKVVLIIMLIILLPQVLVRSVRGSSR